MLHRALPQTAIQTMKIPRPKLLACAAASAFCSSSGQAWVHTALSRSSRESFPLLLPSSLHRPTCTATTGTIRVASRTFASNNGSDNKDSGGFLSGLEKAAKSVLPTKWFGTQEEKAKLAKRQKVEDDISGGLDQMLKDAPLGIRMMGKMVAPLMSKAAGAMAETMAEQQRSIEVLLEDATGYMLNDPIVTKVLGAPIQVGAPFQQSSSTMNVNGQTQSRIELGFPVSGSKGQGVAKLLASSQDGISQLLLEAEGRLITVSLQKKRIPSSQSSSSSSSSRFGDNNDDGDIIEAEIIEKKTK